MPATAHFAHIRDFIAAQSIYISEASVLLTGREWSKGMFQNTDLRVYLPVNKKLMWI
jgi:cytidylate kinase